MFRGRIHEVYGTLFKEAKHPLTKATWLSIVEEYSLPELTFNQDQSVEISGLAKHIQASMNDEYFIGM